MSSANNHAYITSLVYESELTSLYPRVYSLYPFSLYLLIPLSNSYIPLTNPLIFISTWPIDEDDCLQSTLENKNLTFHTPVHTSRAHCSQIILAIYPFNYYFY